MQFNIIKYRSIIEKARTSFWFIPTFMVLSSIMLAVFTVTIDALYIERLEISIPLVYKMDLGAIRSLLATIAGAMITVTSIAFSLTIVALTLASSQFGPRLLRNFMMDTGTQVVLGAFISNFLFCILVFCAISFQEPYVFKPGLTVFIAVLMTCISVGVLIYFIHHVAKAIQADVVIDDVYQELQTSIDNLFPSIAEQQSPAELAKLYEMDVTQGFTRTSVLAKCSGYVQTTDHEALVILASHHKVLIECLFAPGNYVVQDSVIATVYAENVTNQKLVNEISVLIVLGAYRTPVQDPEFAIHQLVEIALRALSPGINDPYTAITCVDKLNSVLCGLTKRAFPLKQHCDQTGTFRVTCKVLTFDDIARAAFDQIRQEANTNVSVTIRLLKALYNLMLFADTDEQKNFVISQTKMIDEQQSKQPLAEADSNCIGQRVAQIFSSLS